MEIQSFRALFGDSIRAWLDWDRLAKLDVRITETVVTDAVDLGAIWSVWYATSDGRPGDWRDAGSHPMKIAEAASTPSTWPKDRASRIEFFRNRFRESAEPVTLLLPAYAVEASLLLLDSSHRVVSAYLDNVAVRALILAIDGPTDAEILPDLPRVAAEALGV